jgi:hypothetical protein
MNLRQRALFCIGPTKMPAACSVRTRSDRTLDPLVWARSRIEQYQCGQSLAAEWVSRRPREMIFSRLCLWLCPRTQPCWSLVGGR